MNGMLRHCAVSAWGRLGTAVLLGGFLLATRASGDSLKYNATYLGSLDAVGLDDQGRVYLNQTVQDTWQTNALRYNPYGTAAGTYTNLGTIVDPSANNSQVSQVTGNGTAVIYTYSVPPTQVGVTRSNPYITDGTTTRSYDPHAQPWLGNQFVGINNAGQVLLYGGTVQSGNLVGRVDNGKSVNVINMPAGTTGQILPTAIGSGGQVIGTAIVNPGPNNAYEVRQAFVAQNGTTTILGALGGPLANSNAVAINASGQIVGNTETGPPTITPQAPGYGYQREPAISDAFLYSNGKMVSLSTLIGQSIAWTSAIGINDKGTILLNTPNGAGVYDGKSFHFLQDMLDPTANVHDLYPVAINNLGQIVVDGVFGTNQVGAILLSPDNLPTPAPIPEPVPEPSSYLVFGFVAAVFGIYRVRHRAVSGRD